MNLIDANILLYAYDESSDHHHAAAEFLRAELSGSQPVGFAWSAILGFLRIGTNSRAFTNPMTIQEACAHVSSWLERPMATILDPTHQHWELLSKLLVESQAGGNLVTDAHLAALALEHGATVCSSDQDFSRFPSLSWTNPLRKAP